MPESSPSPAAPKRLYLAGPMTGLPGFNYDAFNEAAKRLRAAGYDVTNPADGEDASGKTPRGEMLLRNLRRLLDVLEAGGAVAVLPGWEKSAGAKLEVLIAQEIGRDKREGNILDAVTLRRLEPYVCCEVYPLPLLASVIGEPREFTTA